MKPTLIVLILAATQTLYAQDTQWPDPVANDVLPYATAGFPARAAAGRRHGHFSQSLVADADGY